MPCVPAPVCRFRRHALAAAALACCLAALPAQPQSTTSRVGWVDWFSAGPDTAGGSMDVGAGSRVTVTFNGEYTSALPGAFFEPYWGPEATYTGGPNGPIGNAPPRMSDAIFLAGGVGKRMVISFSEAVTNPVFAIASLGLLNETRTARIRASMVFEQDFEILTNGPNYFARGEFEPFGASGTRELFGTESSGVIRFNGTFSQIAWTSPLREVDADGNLVGTYMFTVGSAGCDNYELKPNPLDKAARVRAGCTAFTRGSFAQAAALDVAGALRTDGPFSVQAPLTVAAGGRLDPGARVDVNAGQTLTLAGTMLGVDTVGVHGRVQTAAGSEWSAGGLDLAAGGEIVVGGRATFGGAGKPVTVRGSLQLLPGAVVESLAPLTASGTTARVEVAAGASLDSGGGMRLNDGSTTEVSGSLRVPFGLTVDNATLRVLPGGSLTAGLGMSFDGTVTNRGTMTLTDADLRTGARTAFTNEGTLSLNGGRLSMEPSAVFNNIRGAQLLIDGASLQLNGGTFDNLGALVVGGTSRLDGGGASLVNAGSVSVRSGGALAVGAGAGFRSDVGRFEVAINGRLTFESGAQPLRLAVASVLRVDIAGDVEMQPGTLISTTEAGLIDLSGTMFLHAAQLRSNGRFVVRDGGSLRLDGGVVTIGGLGFEIGYGSRVYGSGTFLLESGPLTVNGFLQVPVALLQGGVLLGNGAILGTTMLGSTVNASTIRLSPGNSPGRLTFEGAVEMDSVELEMEIGRGVGDQIVVRGPLSVNEAVLRVRPLAGYEPELDDRYTFIEAASGLPGFEAGSAPVAGTLVVDTAALPVEWSAGWLASGGGAGQRLTLGLDRADAVEAVFSPSSDTRVAPDTFAWMRSAELVNRLEVAGRLTQRDNGIDPFDGAVLPSQFNTTPTASLAVLEGGRFALRSQMRSQGSIDNAGRFEVREGARLQNLGQALNRADWRNDGQFDNAGDFRNAEAAQLTSRGQIENTGMWTNEGRMQLLTGAMRNDNSFYNLGAARLEVAEGAAFVGEGVFSQLDQAVTVVDGRLAQSTLLFAGGRIEGRGRIEGGARLSGGAELRPGGAAIGTLAFSGFVTLDGARLQLQVEADGRDQLDMTFAQVSFGASGLDVALLFGAGLAPTAGTPYVLLSTFPGVPPSLDLVRVENWVSGPLGPTPWEPGSAYVGTLRWDLDNGRLVYTISAVPEPSAWALMAGGLGVLAWLARRRRAGAPG